MDASVWPNTCGGLIMKQLIGYFEFIKTERNSVTNGVTVFTEGCVEDLMLAVYEISVIDGILYVFRLKEKKYDGEKDVVLVSNNFTLITQ